MGGWQLTLLMYMEAAQDPRFSSIWNGIRTELPDSLSACARLLLRLNPAADFKGVRGALHRQRCSNYVIDMKGSGKKSSRSRKPSSGQGFGAKPSSGQGFGAKPQKSLAEESNRPPQWNEFERWLAANGVVNNGIELAEFESGLRGIRATRTIKPRETLLRVPREIILDEDLADTTVGGLWADFPETPAHVRLALLVLHETRKGEASDFACYIRMLPTMDNFIADGGPAELWNASELALTECPLLISHVEQRRAVTASYSVLDLERLAERWKTLGLAGAPPNAKDLEWAMAVITSRAYGVHRDDGTMLSLVIPMVDMANHKIPSNTVKGMLPDGKHFDIMASEKISRGDQVYLSYADNFPNFKFLNQYGFVVPGYDTDAAIVDCAALVDNEAASTIASDYLMRDGPNGAISRWQAASPQLREALRLLSTNGALPRSLFDKGLTDGDEAYASLIRSTLDGFSSTVGDDRSMLRNDLPPRTRLAVQYRLEQKTLLNRELVSLQEVSKRDNAEGL